MTEHLRLNGVYWGLTALHLLGDPQALPRDETIQFVLSCQNADGGFGAAPGHDSHMLYTVSAVQILATVNGLAELQRPEVGGPLQVGNCKSDAYCTWLGIQNHVTNSPDIAHLQDRQSGTFAGDEWGERDTRFLFGAFLALSLLDLMDLVDVGMAVEHIKACANFDGGFGTSPGAESHAGQIYTCVGALSIADRLDLVDKDRLGGWLSERQLANGGLNGRPEKVEDVCYSWWVLSSLAVIGRLHWIDATKLTKFVLRCQVTCPSSVSSQLSRAQDTEMGGISDRPGDMVDVFHTLFGVAGLSLLGYPGLVAVDPV